MKNKLRQELFGFARTMNSPRRTARRKTKVPHRRRPELCLGQGAHVTIRIREGLPGMRCREALELVRSCMTSARERHGMRIVAWSLMSNHVHLIVEAEGREALARGMQGLKVRLARGLNRLWQRQGSVFAERYHAEVLRTARQVRHAFCYVLHNAKRHGCAVSDGEDPFSSGPWFDGWVPSSGVRRPEGISAPCVPGRTRLLAVAWRRWGLLYPGETPARTYRAPELGRRVFPRTTAMDSPSLFDRAL